MLKEFFVSELKRLGQASSTIFQQDEAPAHFSRDVCQYFDKVFLIDGWEGLVPSDGHYVPLNFFL